MKTTRSQTTNSLHQTLKDVFTRLPEKRRGQFWILLTAMVGVAIFETFSLGMVALFASAVTDPATSLKSDYIVWLKNYVSWPFLSNPRYFIIFLGIVVMVVIPCKNIARGYIMYWISRYSAAVEAHFGEKLLNGFLSKNYQWLLDKNTADLVLGIDWRSYLGRNLIMPMLKALSDITVVVFLLTALIIIKPVVSCLVLLIIGAAAYFIYFKLRKYIDVAAAKCSVLVQNINRNCTKAIHGIKDVKISGTKNIFVNEFIGSALPFARYYAWQNFLSQTPTLILESIGFIMLSFMVCFMLLVINDSLAAVTGTLTLLAVTAWRVLPAINKIVSYLASFRSALPYIVIELDYLNQVEPELSQKEDSSIVETITFDKKIELEKVLFSYQGDNNAVIRNLSMCIGKGETIGIIGFSGAGKSTIVDLLIGLLVPDQGYVKVDGEKITGSNINAWISHIGYVSQSPYIFDGTLAENVAFGIPEKRIDKNKVHECGQMAAMDFLDDLHDGIDTCIGERGIRLSGGQQQRVAIARALYHNPDVLIFDEATSALDSKSEEAILKTIYGFKGRQTMIIIAHRLSTVEQCDRVAWIDKGMLRDIDVPEKILPVYRQEMKIRPERQRGSVPWGASHGDGN